jgi:hypothetical protein
METVGEHDLRFIGDEVPKDDESHIEYFKSLAMKGIKQAPHFKRKDPDDIQQSAEENFTMGHKYAMSLLVAVVSLPSDGIQSLLRETDKKPNKIMT